MRKEILFFVLAISLVCVPWVSWAGKPVKVEVLYMNHGPLQDSLKEIQKVFSRYKGQVDVSWYDYDTKEGEAFMIKKGITQHIPLVIWMDNQVKSRVDGKEIAFTGFPTGAGPASFQGKWTTADLRKVLDQLTDKN